MFQAISLYHHPKDAGDFDSRYLAQHRKFVEKIPHLKHMSVSWPMAGDDDEPPPYHAVALLYWESEQLAMQALSSEAGHAARRDAESFADSGLTTMFADSHVRIPFAPLGRHASESRTVMGLYRQPADTTAFNSHYRRTHSELAAKMPALQSFTYSWTRPQTVQGTPPYYLVGAQEWESEEALTDALNSAETKLAIDDLPNLRAETTMLVCRTRILV